MRYIILSDSNIDLNDNKDFETPKQLLEINGERLIDRTIRLLRQNGVEDIIVTTHDKRFNRVNAEIYAPKFNDYDPRVEKSHWVKAFPIELMDKPTCYLFGDVYYSEKAIKTIVSKDNYNVLYFCTYENKSPYYIKQWDEPLGWKVHNFDKFKFHINKLIDMWNNNETCRRPINWELYRSINGQDINIHEITTNCIIINDESCDIDTKEDITLLNEMIGGMEMIKVEVIEKFTLEKFDELKNIVRYNLNLNENGKLYVGDTFECTEEMYKYLTGKNDKGKTVVKHIEVTPKIIETIKANGKTYGFKEAEVKNTEENITPLGDITPIAKEIEKATKVKQKKKNKK